MPEEEKKSPTCTNPLCSSPGPALLVKSERLSSPRVWFCPFCWAYYDAVMMPSLQEITAV